GLRRLFDHALTLVGERSNAAIRDALATHLRDQLPAAAAAEALVLYDRYLAYLAAVDREPALHAHDAEMRLSRLHALRHEHLGERMAEGFFGDEEALARHSIARRSIAADPTLDNATRQAQLAALDGALPHTLAAARRSAVQAAEAEALQAALDARQADAAARHRERAARFGEAAAQRLALLDAQRADWDARVAAYARERARLGLDPAQAEGAQQAAFAQLRARHFDAAGQRRIASLEAVGALPPGG
ncbi:MAG: lipase secretion chaperone, partial [Silanimonas sp.]